MSGGDKHPCKGCGYMMRGGPMCGDCREYGPPREWHWEYDDATARHYRKHGPLAVRAAAVQPPDHQLILDWPSDIAA